MSHDFRSYLFPVPDSEKIACVVAGYRGKIFSYQKVIQTLNARGYSVVAYEHSPSVITSGDPRRLIDLVEAICHDFAEKARHYESALCTGASIGAGLCFEIQRRFPVVKYGIYAAAGVSPPENIFEAPLFYFARKRFMKHGFGPQYLKEAWRKIDIVPERPLNLHAPFTIALGLNDRIVKYDKALATLKAWQAVGKPIEVISVPKVGHIGIIGWYKRHFKELLDSAEQKLSM